MDKSFDTKSLSKGEKSLLMTALNYVEIESLGLGDLTSQDIRVNIMYDIPLDENMVKACIYAMRQSLSLFDPCDAGVQYYQDVLNKLLQF